jgi:tetratricopeptide (TPR) repeat protein
MLSRWKTPIVFAALGCGLFLSGPALGVDEGQQIQMLKQMFSQPQPEWLGILRENSGLLDQSFFERVDARIRWSADNNQIDDAIRFAMVGDFACDAAGRVGGYRLGLVVAFQKAGNDEMAQILIDNILLTHPNSTEARFLRAAYRRAALDLQGAIDDYEFVIGMNYRTADCCYYVGQTFLALDKQPQAKSWFQRGLAADPKHVGCSVELEKMSALAAPGPNDGFSEIPISNPVVRNVDPKQHAQYFSKAEAAARAGRLGEAENYYKDACAADPKQAPYWIYLGALHYKLGRPDMAAEEIRRGLGVNPKSAEGWRYLGCCYERVFDKTLAPGDLQNAKTSYQKVVELMPGDPIARMALERLSLKKPKSATDK